MGEHPSTTTRPSRKNQVSGQRGEPQSSLLCPVRSVTTTTLASELTASMGLTTRRLGVMPRGIGVQCSGSVGTIVGDVSRQVWDHRKQAPVVPQRPCTIHLWPRPPKIGNEHDLVEHLPSSGLEVRVLTMVRLKRCWSCLASIPAQEASGTESAKPSIWLPRKMSRCLFVNS